MIFIPIGIDCFFAGLLRDINLRKLAFPFDWCVTYNGVSKIIDNDFDTFIPKDNIQLNKEYDIVLNHYFEEQINISKNKYERRIDRFKNILETSTEEVIFIRKGHSSSHHEEFESVYKTYENNNKILKSDIEDANDLIYILNKKYPNLNYKIIIFLMCPLCFEKNKNYNILNDKLKIYNISMNVKNNVHDKVLRDCFLKVLNEI